MKKPLLTILLFISWTYAFSGHIKGGFFNYQYLGAGISDPSKLNYKVTLTSYMECNAGLGQVDPYINITIFNGATSNIYTSLRVFKTQDYLLQKNYMDPCISGDQTACYYKIVVYELNNLELPVSPEGYTISYQRCCRIKNMDNISNSSDIGITYTIQIPGTSSLVPDAIKNSSPIFPINDTVVICESNYFKYPFTASDIDGDSLSYTFCNSFSGGSQIDRAPPTAGAPPYLTVPYYSNYTGATPLGAKVTIDAKTGLISGIAPPIINTGEYAVTVCVTEYRKGVYLGQTRKELHFRVKDCTITSARLNPIPTSCDGFNLNFSNNATNPSGVDYLWEFGEPSSGGFNSSSSPTPTHFYSDTGIYILKLRVSLGGFCADSTTTPVKIYPGFFPGFNVTAPLCKGVPIQFTDITTTKYGKPTGWRWDFGNITATDDTSHLQNPTYTFAGSDTYKVEFIIGNTFGCIDTIYKDVKILSGSAPNLLPHDTLICFLDTIQLKTTNSGTFLWHPNYNINSITSPNPLVAPVVPTKYYVAFTDISGCTTSDSVFVNVVKTVNINAGNDTTICRTDGLILSTTSNALEYNWTPITYLDNPTAKNPLANPLVDVITYKVVGNIGKCSASTTVTIKTSPYPIAFAGKDTTVCMGKSVQLNATGGIYYQWSPPIFLNNTTIANPVVVKPTITTSYIVTVKNITGCLKPVNDTIIISVFPGVKANAGPSDTTVVLGQPLYLHGSGGENYLWKPSTWLNNITSADPIALPEDDITYQLLITNATGCTDSTNIRIKVYKVPPSLYVPTAFSPNYDGKNDILKPILLGMRTLDYFKVFSRSGALLFSTTQKGSGWDGTFRGNPQDPATYVWMARGTTFTGEIIVRKGYAVLIR